MEGYAFAILSGASAGATVAIGKLISPSLSSLMYVFCMSIMSAILALVWVRVRGEKVIDVLPNTMTKSFYGHVICSFLAVWTFWEGTRLMEAAIASFSVRIELVFILILSALIFRDRLRYFELLGGVLILVGASLMGLDVTKMIRDGQSGDLLGGSGGFLMLISGAAFAGAEVFAKSFAQEISASSLVIWRSVALTGLYAVALSVQGSWSMPSGRDWLIIVASAFFGQFLARLWFMESLKRIALSKASLFSQVEPVVTAILAWLLLGETAAFTAWTGGALILVGCVVLHR